MSAPHPRYRHLLLDPASGPTDPPPPPRDELDSLLRQWHQDNAERATAGRDRLLESLRDQRARPATRSSTSWTITIRRFAPLAVAAVVALLVIPFLFISNKTAPVAVATAKLASNIVLAPDGGRLDAFDPRGAGEAGDILGPCVLRHTDVNAVVAGPFTRVTVTQKFHNPHRSKIEAVYTFPLSHDAAVDRMTMTIGDRVIIGEVKERNLARQTYEAARESGRVASLLEQERPNIFTQSVANIEPGADIDITISYVEQLDVRDGDFEFVFPTVVGPRYIPGGASTEGEPTADKAVASRAKDGSAPTSPVPIPAGFTPRAGLTLLAPARIDPVGDLAESMGTATLTARVSAAQPIAPTPDSADPVSTLGAPVSTFEAIYPDGSREPGRLFASDIGEVGGRWFRLAPLPDPGEPFAAPTTVVPDAHRITPTPTRPETRAGHDISISVTIDAGGPGLIDIESPLHHITRQDVRLRPDGMPSRSKVSLTSETAIPNRDFVLKWRQAAPGVVESVFTSRTDLGDFFAVILQPPNRVEDAAAVARELVFVLDTSGSMGGPPIEAAKAVAQRMIGSMRPQDRLNVITFSGETRVLWSEPRPVSDDNRAEAIRFFDHRDGSGGTEMMSAIETALRPSFEAIGEGAISPRELASLPADGRVVTVRVEDHDLDSSGLTTDSVLVDGRMILKSEVDPPITARVEGIKLPRTYLREAERHLGDATKLSLFVRGRWSTEPGREPEWVFTADSTALADAPPVRPLRIVVFLTDGYVGNDHAIIDAIQRHRDSTRVFSIGIGNSVNRYLLDGMARAGGGTADYILIPPNNTAATDPAATKQLASAVQAAADRLHTRTRSPVLTHITAEFSPGLAVADVEPPLRQLPDLFDARPLVLLGRVLEPGSGSVTISGQTVAGVWRRTIPIKLDERAPVQPTSDELGASVVPNLWARARIDSLLDTHLAELQTDSVPLDIRGQIVQLGESFGLMSPYTSFVAVDHQRVTIDGQPTLVPIPIELPDSTRWEGFFGSDVPTKAAAQALRDERRSAKDDIGLKEELSAGASASSGSIPPPTAKPASRKREGAVPWSVTPASPPPPPGPTGGATPLAVEPAEVMTESAPVAEESRKRSDQPRAPAGGRNEPRRALAGRESTRTESDRDASGQPGLDVFPEQLRSDLKIQNLAAESFYNRVARQLEVTESLGQAPPDRLAVAAGANYIAQNIRGGQITAANRARELFLNHYPDSALLNDVAAAATSAERQQQLQQPPSTDAESSSRRTGAAEPADAAAKLDRGYVLPPDVEALALRAEQAATREQLLLRRLDPRLYEMLPAPTPSPSYQQLRSQQNLLRNSQNMQQSGRSDVYGRNIVQIGPQLLVSILLESTDEATLEALKAAGFRLETRLDASNTVVGAIAINQLESLAVIAGVRRIEPVIRP